MELVTACKKILQEKCLTFDDTCELELALENQNKEIKTLQLLLQEI